MAWGSLEGNPVAVGVRPAWGCLEVVREEDTWAEEAPAVEATVTVVEEAGWTAAETLASLVGWAVGTEAGYAAAAERVVEATAEARVAAWEGA